MIHSQRQRLFESIETRIEKRGFLLGGFGRAGLPRAAGKLSRAEARCVANLRFFLLFQHLGVFTREIEQLNAHPCRRELLVGFPRQFGEQPLFHGRELPSRRRAINAGEVFREPALGDPPDEEVAFESGEDRFAGCPFSLSLGLGARIGEQPAEKAGEVRGRPRQKRRVFLRRQRPGIGPSPRE